MNEDRFWFLLARQLADEASSAEIAELRLLLQQNPGNEYLADIISTYFKASPGGIEVGTSDTEFNQRIQRIISAGQQESMASALPAEDGEELIIRKEKRVVSLRRLLPYAAVLAGICVTGWFFRNSSETVVRTEHAAAQTSEVVAKPGARTKLVLPDGTQVWLNSGSRLHYNNDFNARLREVSLEGEAFFDVAKNAAHPFIVHTSAINVKVLGTAFNIRSYPRDEIIETTLLRGMVEITRKDDPSTPKVILRPNEKLVINITHDPVRPASSGAQHPEQAAARVSNISVTPIPKNIPDSDKVEISWMYNKLVFDGDSFEELAAKMERWYNVKITFKSDRLFRYRFKGVFNNETIREALDALRLTARFSYTIRDNEIILNKE